MEKLKVILGKIFTDTLIKRIKSYIWRGLMMLLAIAIQVVAANLNLFELDTKTTVILGLFLGEVSKYLNTKYELESKMADVLEVGKGQ
jgi:hypothetical protein